MLTLEVSFLFIPPSRTGDRYFTQLIPRASIYVLYLREIAPYTDALFPKLQAVATYLIYFRLKSLSLGDNSRILPFLRGRNRVTGVFRYVPPGLVRRPRKK